MSPFEEFVDDVEVSITEAVDSLDEEQSVRLYAEILDLEQRLEALQDALAVLAASGGNDREHLARLVLTRR